MTTSFTKWGATAFGGSPPSGDTLTASISGTATAGDVLLLCTSGIDGDGNQIPVVSDDGGDSGAAWEQVATRLSDDTSGRVTWWQKVCVGGETTVQALWPDSSNKAMVGVWASSLSQPQPYVIDHGDLVWNGTSMVFACASSPRTDHESYVAMAGWARDDVTFADIDSPPGSTQGIDFYSSGTAGAVAHLNDDESANTTADALAYTFRPNEGVMAAVLFWGFDEGSTDLAGNAGFLIGGETPLQVTAGIVALAGDAPLILGGRAPLSQTGGESPLAGLGRLLLGGSAPLSAPTPFPPQPPTPPLTGQLDCGVYDVFIFTRGLGQIVGRIPFNQVNWTRVLDDTSTAEVTVDGVSNVGPMASCCQLLGWIQPWEHELAIMRNGQRVWSGPVVHVSYPSEQVIIDAQDLSGWLAIRTLHFNHNDVGVDLANIWVEYVDDAMSVDNSAGVYPLVQDLTGVTADRLYTEDMHTLASDSISELARTGLDWYVVDRRMVGGDVTVQPPSYPDATPIPTLIDESFRDAPTVDRDGTLMANCWYVNGMGSGSAGNALFGEYGPDFPATPDHVAQPAAPDYDAIEGQFGRIEQIASETRILDQPSIDQNAATRYDLTKLPVDVISAGTLLPTAGISIQQLIPGAVQNVHLTRACVQIGAPYRLKQLTVTGNNDGSEDVVGTWEPLGSLTAHTDLD